MGMLSNALSFEIPERPARAASQNCLTPTPRADTTPNPVTTVRGLNADFSWLPVDSFRLVSTLRVRATERKRCMKCVPSDAQRKGTAERRNTCSDAKGTDLGRGRGARLRRGQRGKSNRAFVLRQLSISKVKGGRRARCADVLNESGAGDDQADNVVKIRIIIDAVTPGRIRWTHVCEAGQPDDQSEEEAREAGGPRTESRHGAFDTPELGESQMGDTVQYCWRKGGR